MTRSSAPDQTSPHPSLKVSRIVKAAPSRVFDAWTDPEQIKQWWGPGKATCPQASVDLRPGGKFTIANKMEDGSIVWIRGEFLEIDKPRRLKYSWISGTKMIEPTSVTIVFDPHPEGTQIIVLHERFASKEARDAHLFGWDGCLAGLLEFFNN